MAHYYNARRSAERKIMVPLTAEEARMAVEALRHVGGDVFEDQPGEYVLYDASTAVAEAIDGAERAKKGSRS